MGSLLNHITAGFLQNSNINLTRGQVIWETIYSAICKHCLWTPGFVYLFIYLSSFLDQCPKKSLFFFSPWIPVYQISSFKCQEVTVSSSNLRSRLSGLLSSSVPALILHHIPLSPSQCQRAKLLLSQGLAYSGEMSFEHGLANLEKAKLWV